MPEIDFKGLSAHYRTWGEGAPVFFLHSGGSSGAQWEKTARVLQGQCRMVAPDALGFGQTEVWPQAGALTHELQAELVSNIILRQADGPVDVIGHSYGGGTALRLAIAWPQLVRSLVLIEPVAGSVLKDVGDPLFKENGTLARLFIASVDAGRPEVGWEAFLDSRNRPGTWARLTDEQRQRFLLQSRQTSDAFFSNLAHMITLAECRRIAVPTTIVVGTESLEVDRRITTLLHETIDDALRVEIPGAGHMSPLTHPQQVADIVRDHLARVRNSFSFRPLAARG